MRGAVATSSVLCAFLMATAASAQFEVNPTARGQSKPKRFEVSGFIGMLSVNQSLGTATNIYQTVTGEAENIDFGKLLGFRASWAFTSMITAEFNVSRGNNTHALTVDDETVGTENLAEQFETDQLFLGGNLILQFPRGHFVPYVTGGGGLHRMTPTSPIAEIEHVSAFDINFGGGIKLWFPSPDRLAVRVDLRYHTATVGITFPGGSSKPKGLELTIGASIAIF